MILGSLSLWRPRKRLPYCLDGSFSVSALDNGSTEATLLKLWRPTQSGFPAHSLWTLWSCWRERRCWPTCLNWVALRNLFLYGKFFACWRMLERPNLRAIYSLLIIFINLDLVFSTITRFSSKGQDAIMFKVFLTSTVKLCLVFPSVSFLFTSLFTLQTDSPKTSSCRSVWDSATTPSAETMWRVTRLWHLCWTERSKEEVKRARAQSHQRRSARRRTRTKIQLPRRQEKMATKTKYWWLNKCSAWVSSYNHQSSVFESKLHICALSPPTQYGSFLLLIAIWSFFSC